MSMIKLASAGIVMIVVGLMAIVNPAHAEPAAQVVYWQGAHATGLNKACSDGAKTIFDIQLRVRKGERVNDGGVFSLRMKSGRDLVSDDGYIVRRHHHRLAEYYVYAGQKAKVDKWHPRSSYAYPASLSEGAHPKTRIMRVCQGE